MNDSLKLIACFAFSKSYCICFSEILVFFFNTGVKMKLGFIYAPINVNPKGGGGRADPGEFDIFMEARVKFPTPRHLLNVKFPPLG